jgi:hypothetical protein
MGGYGVRRSAPLWIMAAFEVQSGAERRTPKAPRRRRKPIPLIVAANQGLFLPA